MARRGDWLVYRSSLKEWLCLFAQFRIYYRNCVGLLHFFNLPAVPWSLASWNLERINIPQEGPWKTWHSCSLHWELDHRGTITSSHERSGHSQSLYIRILKENESPIRSSNEITYYHGGTLSSSSESPTLVPLEYNSRDPDFDLLEKLVYLPIILCNSKTCPFYEHSWDKTVDGIYIVFGLKERLETQYSCWKTISAWATQEGRGRRIQRRYARLGTRTRKWFVYECDGADETWRRMMSMKWILRDRLLFALRRIQSRDRAHEDRVNLALSRLF